MQKACPWPPAPSPPPRPDTVPPIAHGGSTLARPYASAFTTLAPASVTLTRQFVGTACRPFSCEEPRREAPRQLRQRHEGPPDGGPTMPQSPHTLPSHTHTHYHLNPSTTIHPAAGTAAPKLDATPSPVPSPPARPHDSRCKTVYGFVINDIVLLRGHSSPPRRGRVVSRARGRRRRGPRRARGQPAGNGDTPSAPIKVRQTVTDIPTLIRLTASDQPDTDRGCLGAAVRLSALARPSSTPNTHSTREMRRGCAQISTRSATTRQMQ